MNIPVLPASLRALPSGRVPAILGAFGFGAGALFLLTVYLGILAIAQSPEHALQQLQQDAGWVGLVALGFGAQLGLFAYGRALARGAARGGLLATGTGTGTSTLGMVACCAHHLTDVAPLIGLAGFGGLASLLAEWKLPFILLGLAVNAVGIAVSLRHLRHYHT